MRRPGERWVFAILGVALAAAVGMAWYWFSYRPIHGAPDEVEVACVLGHGAERVLLLREGVRRGLGLGTVHRLDLLDAATGARRGRFQLEPDAAVIGCAEGSFWLRPGASGLEVRGLDGQRLGDPAPGTQPPPAPLRYTAPATGHVEGAPLLDARFPRTDGDGAQPLVAPPDLLVSHALGSERGSPRVLTRFTPSPSAAHVVWSHALGSQRLRAVVGLGDRLIVVLSAQRGRRDFRVLALDAHSGAELWNMAP